MVECAESVCGGSVVGRLIGMVPEEKPQAGQNLKKFLDPECVTLAAKSDLLEEGSR